MIIFLWRTGVRIGEALALMPKDVDFDGQQVHVLEGKGKKTRTVAIDNGALTELKVWLVKRETILKERGKQPGRCPLFCTLGGGALFTDSMVPKKRKDGSVVTGDDGSAVLVRRREVSPYIRVLFRRLAVKAGLAWIDDKGEYQGKRVHAHMLRHTLASDLDAESKGLGVIQGQLGHHRASTTDRYLSKISAGRLVEEVGSRDWSFDD